jgi:hypothetical protein
MAHAPEVKAMALGMILTGCRVNHVAKATHIPKQTVSRWRVEADQILFECLRDNGKYPTVSELGRKLRINRD